MNTKYSIKTIYQVIAVIVVAILLFPINSFAASDVFTIISKDDIIPYTYESSSVTSSISSLVDRTEALKSNYSTSEALSIISELSSTTQNITSSDYTNNYNIKHDENLYEAGYLVDADGNQVLDSTTLTEEETAALKVKGFYKYKYGHVEWIERNVICLMLSNSASSSDLKTVVNTIYAIGQTEMANKAPVAESLQVISNLNYVEDDFPSDTQDYVKFLVSQSGYDLVSYENGTTPSTNLDSAYEDYKNSASDMDEILQYIKDNNASVIIVEEPTDDSTDEALADDFYNDPDYNNNTIIDNSSNKTSTATQMDFSSYHKSLSTASTSSYVTTKTSSLKNVYYTLNKTSETIDWTNTGISVNNGEITYANLISVLSIIGRNSGYYYFEDEDMVMLIADGQNIVLNKVEDAITEEEVNSLFDSFEKLGIKVMLQSDTNVDTSNSLENRIKNGEINSISVNGSKLILTNAPILTKNILQLPVEETAKALGYDVSVNGSKITLTYKDTIKSNNANTEEDETSVADNDIETNEVTIVLTVGSSNYTINGTKNSFKTNVTKDDGVIYCEFDKIASTIGFSYTYNATSGVIEFD